MSEQSGTKQPPFLPLWVIALLIAAFGFAYLMAKSSEDPVPHTATQTVQPNSYPASITSTSHGQDSAMDASVQCTNTQFVVENKNDYDWHQVSLTITAKREPDSVASYEYVATIPVIKAHEKIYTDMSRFIGDETGKSFSPNWFNDPDLRQQYFVAGHPGGVEFSINSGTPTKNWNTTNSQNNDIPKL